MFYLLTNVTLVLGGHWACLTQNIRGCGSIPQSTPLPLFNSSYRYHHRHRHQQRHHNCYCYPLPYPAPYCLSFYDLLSILLSSKLSLSLCSVQQILIVVFLYKKNHNFSEKIYFPILAKAVRFLIADPTQQDVMLDCFNEGQDQVNLASLVCLFEFECNSIWVLSLSFCIKEFGKYTSISNYKADIYCLLWWHNIQRRMKNAGYFLIFSLDISLCNCLVFLYNYVLSVCPRTAKSERISRIPIKGNTAGTTVCKASKCRINWNFFCAG